MQSKPETAQQGPFRFMHAMLYVQDLDRTIEFYTAELGMRLLWRREHDTAGFTNALVSYGEESHDPAIEFVKLWKETAAPSPDQRFGHVAFEVRDLTETCARLATSGVKVTSAPRVSSRGNFLMAFIEDPDGNTIELLEDLTGEQGARHGS